MLRFEHCNVKNCVDELLALGNNNMKMWNIFQWLAQHDELQNGTQAEIIKLYVDDELVAYSLLENYEARTDKTVHYQDEQYKAAHNKSATYQDLGVVHFVTLDEHRKKGYATLLADAMFKNIISPLFARHADVHVYVTATGRAAPLMARTDICPTQLIKQFYSDVSFQVKVVDYLSKIK